MATIPTETPDTSPLPTSAPRRSAAETFNLWAEPLSKLILPLALVLITYWIKDSVDIALKERQLEVQTAQGMQAALTTLRTDGVTANAADAAALVLASFGRPAVVLLIREHDVGSPEVSLAAEKGLSVLGLTHQDDLCPALERVIGDRTRRFRIETHRMAVRQLMLADCQALAPLRDYVRFLSGAAITDVGYFEKRYRLEPNPSAIEALRKEVEGALAAIR
jgi:hypothetical protein